MGKKRSGWFYFIMGLLFMSLWKKDEYKEQKYEDIFFV